MSSQKALKPKKKAKPLRARREAWARHERETAVDLGGQRLTRGDNRYKSCPDVTIPRLPHWMIDCKYRETPWVTHAVLREVRRKYCKWPEAMPVVVTKTARERGSVVHMDMCDFKTILAALLGAQMALEDLGDE